MEGGCAKFGKVHRGQIHAKEGRSHFAKKFGGKKDCGQGPRSRGAMGGSRGGNPYKKADKTTWDVVLKGKTTQT